MGQADAEAGALHESLLEYSQQMEYGQAAQNVHRTQTGHGQHQWHYAEEEGRNLHQGLGGLTDGPLMRPGGVTAS